MATPEVMAFGKETLHQNLGFLKFFKGTGSSNIGTARVKWYCQVTVKPVTQILNSLGLSVTKQPLRVVMYFLNDYYNGS